MGKTSLIALRIVPVLAGAFTVYAGFNKAFGGIRTLGWQGESQYLEVTNEHAFLFRCAPTSPSAPTSWVR